MEVALIQMSFVAVGSTQKKNKNENTENYSIFIPFKNQVYSRRGSLIFLLFWS